MIYKKKIVKKLQFVKNEENSKDYLLLFLFKLLMKI